MRPRVVICGSFSKSPYELKRLYRELEATGCRILSPLSIIFEPNHDTFARAESELGATPIEIESMHLRAIREADFIFLHVPNGYVGVSTAFELGFAEAISKPVYCKQLPEDLMLATRVRMTTSVFDALENMAL